MRKIRCKSGSKKARERVEVVGCFGSLGHELGRNKIRVLQNLE